MSIWNLKVKIVIMRTIKTPNFYVLCLHMKVYSLMTDLSVKTSLVEKCKILLIKDALVTYL